MCSGHRLVLVIGSVLVLGVLCGSPALADPPAPVRSLPTAGLIDADGSVTAGLLEARLLASGQARWLERTEISRVVKEQELQAAFGAAGAGERLTLGKLLKAAVLVMLRRVDALDKKEGKLLECVVCETRQGLRLRVATVSEKNVEAAVDTLAEAAAAGLRKYHEDIREVVAVSPLVSDDLGFQHNYLQTAYARLIEQSLQEYPGVAVVELAEAQAIGRELSLTPDERRIVRGSMPLQILGRFRHAGPQEKPTVSLELRLLRGEQELTRTEAKAIEPAAAGAWLQNATSELLKVVKATPTAKADPAAEAKHLARRAAEFSRIGNWEEALALLEASLLLAPDQEVVHHDVVVAITHLIPKYRKYESATPAEMQRAMTIYLQALNHVESFARTAGPLAKYREHSGIDFIGRLEESTNGFAFHPSTTMDVLAIVQETVRIRSATYTRIARSRAQADFRREGWESRAIQGLPRRDQLALAFELIEEFQSLPDGSLRAYLLGLSVPRDESAEYREFLQRMMQSRWPRVRSAGTQIQDFIARLRPSREQPQPASRDPNAFKEILLRPTDFAGNPVVAPILGYRPCGRAKDLLWTTCSVHLMTEPGKLRTLWAMPFGNDRITSVVPEGEYIWISIRRDRKPPLLAVIDRRNDRVSQFSSADGLPEQDNRDGLPDQPQQYIKLAAAGPGRVCLAGYMGRTWLAIATFDGANKSVRVFHEAREAADPEDPAQGNSTLVSFRPTFMCALEATADGKEPQRRAVIGRESRNSQVGSRPLIVDLNREVVLPAMFDFYSAIDDEAFITAMDGKLFLARFNKQLKGPELSQVTVPSMMPERLSADLPDGRCIAHAGEVHIVGKQWWIFDTATSSLRVAASRVPWFYNDHWSRPGKPTAPTLIGGPNDFRLVGAYPSEHYGLLILVTSGSGKRQFLQATRAMEVD